MKISASAFFFGGKRKFNFKTKLEEMGLRPSQKQCDDFVSVHLEKS